VTPPSGGNDRRPWPDRDRLAVAGNRSPGGGGRVCSRAMAAPSRQVQPSALDYLRIVARRKWWVVASIVLVTAAAALYSLSQPKAYSATASIVVQPIPTTGSLTGVTPATLGPYDVPTQENVLGSSVIRRVVRAKLGTAGTISVGTISGTNIITVTSSEPTPREAARVANAYANAYVSYRSGQVTQSLGRAERQLQSRLTGIETLVGSLEKQLSGTPSGSATAQALQAQLQAALSNEGVVQGQLEQLTVGASSASGAQIVTGAKRPTSPSSPKTTRNIGLGFAAGVLLGLVAAVVVDNLDDSIRDKDDLEDVLEGRGPVLGLIPTVEQWKNPEQPLLVSFSSPHSPPAEAYRSLRTALQFVLLDKRVKTLLVSSPLPGEGKSATAANLGVAIARAGQQVLLVSADLRRPRLERFLGCEETIGLSSIALGATTLNEAVQPVLGVRGLWCLGTGPVSPEPSEFLSSRAVSEIMAGAADRFDLVIVDCAPILPVADALATVRWADGFVLVARSGQTRRRDLRRALELLDTADATVFGAVLNNVPDEALGYSGYGYYGTYGDGGSGQHRRSRSSGRQPARRSEPARSSGRAEQPRGPGEEPNVSSAFRAQPPRARPRTAE
jgi:capsular exopolysaccharide synthesis family protein